MAEKMDRLDRPLLTVETVRLLAAEERLLLATDVDGDEPSRRRWPPPPAWRSSSRQ